MAKKRNTSRHKHPQTVIRFHPTMREALEALVARNASDISTEIRIAVREKLTREGLWPPGTDHEAETADDA